MQMNQVHSCAKLLLELHGSKAEVEAARKEHALEDEGNEERALFWRRVRISIKEIRGPHVS